MLLDNLRLGEGAGGRGVKGWQQHSSHACACRRTEDRARCRKERGAERKERRTKRTGGDMLDYTVRRNSE